MKDVQIQKAALITRLKANRAGHRDVFEKATVVYLKKMTELLESLVQRVREGKLVPINALYGLPVPEDHSDDYDVALDMLAVEERDSLTLSQVDFRRYYLDKWEWEASWLANTASYSGGNP